MSTLADIDKQESEAILDAFNADIAFELGCYIRELAREFDKPALICILSPNGLIYFQCCSRPGVLIDNQKWAERKARTVERWCRSSLYIGSKLKQDGRDMLNAFFVSEIDYASHGGGFPIRVRGTEGLQGVLLVSGLKQEEDHELCYLGLKALADGKIGHGTK